MASRLYFIFLLSLSLFFHQNLFACSSHGDCGKGQKCVTQQSGQPGVCADETAPEKAFEQPLAPPPAETNRVFGSQCSTYADCAAGLQCVKSSASDDHGVCRKK